MQKKRMKHTKKPHGKPHESSHYLSPFQLSPHLYLHLPSLHHQTPVPLIIQTSIHLTTQANQTIHCHFPTIHLPTINLSQLIDAQNTSSLNLNLGRNCNLNRYGSRAINSNWFFTTLPIYYKIEHFQAPRYHHEPMSLHLERINMTSRNIRRQTTPSYSYNQTWPKPLFTAIA